MVLAITAITVVIALEQMFAIAQWASFSAFSEASTVIFISSRLSFARSLGDFKHRPKSSMAEINWGVFNQGTHFLSFC